MPIDAYSRFIRLLRGWLRFLPVVILMLFCVLPLTVLAQMDQGTITGMVRDKTGAAIPHAAVTLTSTDTGFVLKTRSDSSGIYSFPPVKVGNYKVSAVAPGFSTTTQENIHVDVQSRLNIALVLVPGRVTQSITVTTAPPALQSQQSSVGQVISTRTINDLPLNSRNWVYAAQLAAGVTPGVGGRGLGTGDFSANGQRPEQNDFILDGIDNNTGAADFLNGSSFVVKPPPDALSEFNVQTSDFSAEFGHSAGAVLNATVKSGTNAIHGDLWEYVRNTALDARDFDALTVPPYHQNQFGATLGAPILRNRLFFFGYAQNNRIVFGQTRTYSVPTALMRQGNFSELLNPDLTSLGKVIKLYEPGSAGTTPLTCNAQANVICSGNIDTVAQRILNDYPLPNVNNGRVFDNYVVTANAVNNTFQWGIRLDANITPRDLAFTRFSYANSPGSYPPPLGPVIDSGPYGADGQIINRGENFVFSETHIFNGTTDNEFRIGYNYGNFRFLQSVFNDQNLAGSLGLGGIPGGSQIGGGLPFGKVGGLSNFGPPQYYPNHKGENIAQLLDNFQKVAGNHTLKFGVAFLNERFPFYSPSGARGVYNYTGYFTSHPGVADTGYGTADFILNQMESATINSATQLDMSRWYRAAYFQDDWRVTRSLTLNLGLRYDHFQPLKEVSGNFANFYSVSQGPGHGIGTLTYPDNQRHTYLAPAFLSILAKNNIPIQYTGVSSIVTPQFANFAPRVGFAYRLNNSTVIRAGFGIFYGGMENFGGSQELENYPFEFNSSFPRANVCKPGNCATNGFLLESGFSKYLAAGLVNSVSKPSFAGSVPSVKTTYTESYNLSVERVLGQNFSLTAAYIGNVGRHLLIEEPRNGPAALIDPRINSITAQPFPTIGGTGVEDYAGASNYNSFQATLQRHYTNGLQFLATYTWAHSLDDAFDQLANAPAEHFRAYNIIGISHDYTNSLFDVRNRFTFNSYYQLPFGRGRRFLNRSTAADLLAGGWAADIQVTAQSGPPFSVTTDLGPAGPNGGTAYAVLVGKPFASGGTPPASNPGITCASSTRNRQHWYNPCAFANPPLAFPGAEVRGSPISTTQITGISALPYLGGRPNTIAGPGIGRMNMSLFKDFHTFREQQLELRADIFNVTNTPAFNYPAVSDNGTNGGEITTPRAIQNLTPDARFFQISAKYIF